jgi:Holliday junction resolvase-like predicted endonuclease
LTEFGRTACSRAGIDPGPRPRESLEHSFWIKKAVVFFEQKGYDVVCEHPVKGNGAIDILAKKPGEHVAIEVETGKSDIKGNLNKIREEGFDRIIVIATSPTATTVCQKVIDSHPEDKSRVEQLSWLDIS